MPSKNPFAFFINHIQNSLAVLFVIFLLSPISQIKAQHYNLKQFDNNNGAPSSFVYNVFEDSKGYLWFLTEKNIARFDGKQFTYFDEKDGYDETGCFRVVEDKDGTLWFLTTSWKIFTYKNGHFNKLNIDYIKYGFAWIDLTKDGKVITIDRDGVFINKFQSNTDIFYSYKTKPNKDIAYNIIEIDTSAFLITTLKGVFFQKKQNRYNILKSNTSTDKVVPRVFKLKNLIYACNNDGIYEYNKKNNNVKLVFPFKDNQVFGITEDTSQNIIWVCTARGLLKFNAPITLNSHPETVFKNETVFSILKSSNHSFWLSTRAKGCFLTNFESKHINIQEKIKSDRIIHVKSLKNIIYFFNEESSFYTLKNNSINKFQLSYPNEQKFAVINFASLIKDSFILIHGTHDKVIIDSKSYDYKKSKSLTPIKLKSSDDLLLFNDPQGTIVDNLNNKLLTGVSLHRIVKFLHKSNIEILSGYPINRDKDTFYFKSNKGLLKIFVIENKIAHQIIINNKDIEDLTKLNNKWVACSKRNGIYIIEGKNIKNITDVSGLASNYTTQCNINGKYLWICTNKGLSRIDTANYGYITNFTSYDYLIDNEVNDISFLKDTVYVATSKGLSYFNKNSVFSNYAPSIFLEKVAINNRDTSLLEKYVLPYTQNNFTFQFNSPGYRSANNNLYRFIVKKGNQIDTSYYKTGVFQLSSLTPGSYEFIVDVKNIDGVWSKTPKTVQIVIQNPFWKTWYFMLSVAFAAFIFIRFTIIGYIKSNKQKQDYDRKMIESELKSLRLYMNPHFIFNSLTSLQSYILTNKTEKANEYISKFSKLIREVMSYSVKGEISLKNDIQLLNTYLELEKVRFGDTFDFEITCQENLETNQLLIPSLMIQPFVENAIKHGIIGLTTRIGHIKVHFMQRNNQLYCTVEDNGIGIDENKKTDGLYSSTGIKFTEERIRLLINKPNKEVIKLEAIIENNQYMGTRVEILVPILNNSKI